MLDVFEWCRRKSSFVKPRVDIPKSRERCPMCGDAKLIKCKDCKGSGKLAVGGYQKRNPLKLDTIIGEKLLLCQNWNVEVLSVLWGLYLGAVGINCRLCVMDQDQSGQLWKLPLVGVILGQCKRGGRERTHIYS